MSNPTPILNNINAFDATKGTTISFNIIGGTDIVRSNIAYIYDLSTNDLICTHLYISTESIHELPPNTDPSIVYADGKSSADFVNNKNYYLQIQTFTNTAGTAGGSGMSVAKTFWCLFNPALSVNAIPAAISTTSYNVGATYTTNITDVTIPVTNIIQQYKFDLYTATGTLVQTSGNIIGSGEQEGTSTTYNITYNFSGLVVNNSYYVVVTATSTEGMTVSAQSNTFAVSIDTPTVGGAIVNNNACDGYISVVSNLSDEYGGHVSGEMASFETDSVNNVSSLKVNMEPIQDLHGYDHPWVGGAGVNKYNASVQRINTGANASIDGDTITATANNGALVITGKNAQSFPAGTYTCSATGINADGFVIWRYTVANNTETQVGSMATARTFTATEPFYLGVSIADAKLGQTVVGKIQLETGSTATSWTPYENICPISGYDSVSANVVGVNVWDEEWEVGTISTTTGQNASNNTLIRSTNYIPCTPSTQYYPKAPSGTGGNILFYDADKNYISYVGMAVNYAFTTPSNAHYMRFRMGSAYGTTYNHDISINYPSTDHDYHAYQGQSYHQDIEVTYTPTVQENEPYQFKRTGDVGGDRESIELVGGTVAWNQLVNYKSKTNRGITATYDSETHIYTLSGTSTGTYAELFGEVNVLAGHKYLCGGRIVSNPNSINIRSRILARMTKYVGNPPMTIGIGLTNGTSNQGIDGFTVDTDFTGVKLQYCCFDLTALFNPTIADYIYNLEQSQAGAGVAFFRNYFSKDYYPYDPGTLRSVEGVSAHETVGFNQWDEEWEVGEVNGATGAKANTGSAIRSKNFIPVISGATYYAHCGGGKLAAVYQYSDKNTSNYIGALYKSNATFMVSADCKYILIASSVSYGTTYNHDICINLSDPSRNGEYEPYVKHTYPLDSSLTLRGVPKLVDGKLAFDGDVYPSSGTVQRRYGVKVFDGTTGPWSVYNGAFYQNMSGYKVRGYHDVTAISDKFVFAGQNSGISDLIEAGRGKFAFRRDTNAVQFYPLDENITTSTQLNSWLASNPVTIVYELATPTTETAEPFTNPQVVDNWGTEAYVTTGIVPVGHDTTYLTRDIFGGTLDLVTGVLTVDRAMVTLDGSEAWTWEGGQHRAYTRRNDAKRFYDYTNHLMCDKLPIAAKYADTKPISVSGYPLNTLYEGQNWIYVGNENISTNEDFLIWLSEVKPTIVYELAQPQTYQLTPHQIQTLVGQNNVWSDAGEVDVTFNLPISNLLVKRQDASDVSGNWLTLYSQPITQASDMDFTYIDFLNQYGKTYRYALVPLLTQQQGGVDVEIEGGYTVSDDVLSVFDGVFVANNNGSQKLKAATEYGDLETNQDVGVLTTIGNKYPFVVSNSNLNYHSGSISALIVPSDFYTSGDLDRLDIVERREAIEQFLTDKTAKILKDWNGNIWLITFVENVEVSFVDDYGMGLGTLSAKWVEIGDVNDQTDLKQTGLI